MIIKNIFFIFKNIETIDFELASERVMAGLEKKQIMSE